MRIGSSAWRVSSGVDIPIDNPSRGGNIIGRPVLVKPGPAHSVGTSFCSAGCNGGTVNASPRIVSRSLLFKRISIEHGYFTLLPDFRPKDIPALPRSCASNALRPIDRPRQVWPKGKGDHRSVPNRQPQTFRPRHFSKSALVFRSSMSRRLAGIPISLTVSPAFTSRA